MLLIKNFHFDITEMSLIAYLVFVSFGLETHARFPILPILYSFRRIMVEEKELRSESLF